MPRRLLGISPLLDCTHTARSGLCATATSASRRACASSRGPYFTPERANGDCWVAKERQEEEEEEEGEEGEGEEDVSLGIDDSEEVAGSGEEA